MADDKRNLAVQGESGNVLSQLCATAFATNRTILEGSDVTGGSALLSRFINGRAMHSVTDQRKW